MKLGVYFWGKKDFLFFFCRDGCEEDIILCVEVWVVRLMRGTFVKIAVIFHSICSKCFKNKIEICPGVASLFSRSKFEFLNTLIKKIYLENLLFNNLKCPFNILSTNLQQNIHKNLKQSPQKSLTILGMVNILQ